MQHQIAQAYTEIAAARALVYNAARKKEAGEAFVQDAAMAKLYASQVAGKVSGLAIEWCGGVGFTREYPAEKYYRDSMIGRIYEGKHKHSICAQEVMMANYGVQERVTSS